MISKHLKIFILLTIITSFIFSCRGKSEGVFSRIALKLTGKTTTMSDSCALLLNNAKTEEENLEALAFCANSNNEYSDVIIPKIMSSISPSEYKIISEFKKNLNDAIDKGLDADRAKASAEDWVNKNVKTDFEGIKDIIKKDLFNYVDSISTKVEIQKP
jgi:hypothetical protein